jgi:hypothetical protein
VSTIKAETIERQAEIHQEANTTWYKQVQPANVAMHQTVIAFHNWVNNGSQGEFVLPKSYRHTVCHAILVCCTPHVISSVGGIHHQLWDVKVAPLSLMEAPVECRQRLIHIPSRQALLAPQILSYFFDI